MLVVGSANMDIVVRAVRAPAAGETVMGLDYALYPGGKGANQAVAASRAGAATRFSVCLGRDAYGDALCAALEADGVDLSAARRTGSPSGVALITVEANGENRIIVVPGANRALRPGSLPNDIGFGTVMLAQLEVPIETVLAAAAEVRAKNGIAVLNVSPVAGVDAAARAALLDAADVLLVNETEAAALLDEAELSAPTHAASRLATGRKAAVITLGADGAVWAGLDGSGQIAGHSVKVADTTACGDAFAGAFAAALEAGAATGQAVRFGNAAGALAATKPGAQPSLPRRSEIVAFLDRSN